MCFSETQSYVHTGLLIAAGIYTLPNYRLAIPAFFFAIKELLQGLLYKYQGDEEKLKLFASLSWIHISLHPLMFNLIFSNLILPDIGALALDCSTDELAAPPIWKVLIVN